MNISMSEITTLPLPLEEDLPAFAAAGFGAVEVSLGKVDRFVEKHSVEALVDLLARLGLQPTGAIGLAPTGPALLLGRDAVFDEYLLSLRRQFELCRALGIAEIGVGADAAKWRPQEDWHDGAIANVRAAATIAEDHGVRIGIEFMSLGAPIGPFILDSLAETRALVEAIDHPAVGYNIDFFHHYRSGGTVEELAAVDPTRVRGVHVTDVVAGELTSLKDGDRVLPGEGVAPIWAYRDALLSIGYDGWWVLELLNEALWKRDPRMVADLGLAAMRRFAQ